MLVAGFALIAGAVVAAMPITPQPWFDFAEDYPMKAFEKKWEGITQFRLLIAPDGNIVDCTVTKSSGYQEFDTKTCFLTQRRVEFRPARNSEGQPVYGVYRGEVRWAMPERSLIAEATPDLELSLNKLPAGVNQPAAVKLAYSVDAQGNVSSCTLMPSSLRQPGVLVELGCRELLQRETGKPVVGPSGQPVPAVKTGAVLFKDDG